MCHGLESIKGDDRGDEKGWYSGVSLLGLSKQCVGHMTYWATRWYMAWNFFWKNSARWICDPIRHESEVNPARSFHFLLIRLERAHVVCILFLLLFIPPPCFSSWSFQTWFSIYGLLVVIATYLQPVLLTCIHERDPMSPSCLLSSTNIRIHKPLTWQQAPYKLSIHPSIHLFRIWVPPYFLTPFEYLCDDSFGPCTCLFPHVR